MSPETYLNRNLHMNKVCAVMPDAPDMRGKRVSACDLTASCQGETPRVKQWA